MSYTYGTSKLAVQTKLFICLHVCPQTGKNLSNSSLFNLMSQVWKTLKTAETSLMDMINQKDYDVSAKFQDDNQPPKSPHEYVKKRSDRLETEAYYITVRLLKHVLYMTNKHCNA